MLPLPWGHRAAKAGAELRPASLHHWQPPVTGAALGSGGTLFLGVSWAHLARMTRWYQEYLFFPCPGREVAPNLLMKKGYAYGYHVGS